MMESESDGDLEPVDYVDDEPADTSKRNVGRSDDPRRLQCGAFPEGDDLQSIMMP